MPTTIAPPDQESQTIARKVCEAGRIGLEGGRVVCSKALAGQIVALRAISTASSTSDVLAQVDLR